MLGQHETASDLTQDTLVKVLQGLDRYDGRAAFSTWVIRIAMNACLSHLRKEKHRRTGSLGGDRGGEDGAPGQGPGNPGGDPRLAIRDGDSAGWALRTGANPTAGFRPSGMGGIGEPAEGSSVQREEEKAILLAALEAIDPVHRALIVLRDLQGLEYEHISTVLGAPLGTVKSRLFRARAALRNVLEEQGWTGHDGPSGTAE